MFIADLPSSASDVFCRLSEIKSVFKYSGVLPDRIGVTNGISGGGRQLLDHARNLDVLALVTLVDDRRKIW